MQQQKSSLTDDSIALIKNSKSYGTTLLILIILLILSVGLSVSLGQVQIPLKDSYSILLNKLFGIKTAAFENISQDSYVDIIWLIRFPRVLTALLVGASLTMCGTIMQASVQNPLADPYILGISSGASLGATFSILIGFGATSFIGQSSVAFGAFVGAFGAALLVLALANIGGRVTSSKLILSGMVVNALFTAFSNFIVYFANDAEGIKTVTFWVMGSLASAKWDRLPLLSIVVITAITFFITQSRILNTMLIGDETAVTLGINLGIYRKAYLLFSSLLTGIVVASCGMIGFVGLIIPHIVRSLVGANHKKLMPVSILLGALFLILADLLSRIILPTSEIPIGIITSMIGAPLFMYMLIKKGYGFGGR